MIKALAYRVTFPSTGRTLELNQSFDLGMTAITGANETGKSFVVEMVRFALFGTAALRATADQYADMDVTLDFAVRGKDYRVWRTIDKAKLSTDTLLANGVRAVNKQVLSVLGFDMSVFDVACVTNQGQVERLGDMKPGERKRMVDQVIGVDKLDELTKWCVEQGALLGREIEVLQRGLVEPTAPEKPEGYHCSSSLRLQVDKLRAMKQELDQLRGWLSVTRPEPVLRARPAVTATEAELAEIDAIDAKRKHLLSLPVVDFDPEEVREWWERWDAWEGWDIFKSHHPRPVLTRETIGQLSGLEAKRERLHDLSLQRARFDKSPLVKCPHCQTDFCLGHEPISALDAEIAALGILPPTQYTMAQLQEEARRNSDWEQLAVQEMASVLRFEGEKPPKPTVTRAQLAAAALGVTSKFRQNELDQLPNHRPRADVASELADLQRWVIEAKAYNAECDSFATWYAEYTTKQERADALAPSINALPSLVEALQCSVAYEQAVAVYDVAQARYVAQQAELAAKSAERDGWRLARIFIAEVRARIKTYLVPSLSRVASHLLTQMTGGQRTEIVVDEEFEITVDRQPLGTLSGSGKACANLALRIGLGQVLTHNVLSLFIGDEIDASMDADRAENVHASLQRLTDRISQIFLISHKSPAADFTVTLGEQGFDRQ